MTMIELALVLSGAAALAWYWWKRRQWLKHERTIVTEQQVATHVKEHARYAPPKREPYARTAEPVYSRSTEYEPDCAFTHQAAHLATLATLSADDSPTTPVATESWSSSDSDSGSGFGGAGASDSWDSSSSDSGSSSND